MTRDPRLAWLFDGPSPTAMRIDGMRDARGGRPRMSRKTEYLAGYEAGLTYGCAAERGEKPTGSPRP